ncbi:unnamed protein product [Rotaria sp. Silwood2]|nr:unnamed protein product [Rotaria sp. Silwood2]CAF4179531.1 unnamed protein product [Rotaria sp. Silwood2]
MFDFNLLIIFFFYTGPVLLDLILAERGDDTISKLIDEDIYEEVLLTLYNLANNSDICHRLEMEIGLVLNDNEEITPSTLSLLAYTESVVKEFLRLHQPIQFIVRKAIEDNILVDSDGKKIYVKTVVLIL